LMYAEVEEEKGEEKAEVATTGLEDGGSHGDVKGKGKGTVAVLPVWGRVAGFV